MSKLACKSGEEDDKGTVPFSVEPATSSAPLSLPSLSASNHTAVVASSSFSNSNFTGSEDRPRLVTPIYRPINPNQLFTEIQLIHMNADCWRVLLSHVPIRIVLSRALVCDHWNNLVAESNNVRKSLFLSSRQDVLLYGPVRFFLFSRLPKVAESVFAAYYKALFNQNNQIQCLSTITDFATDDWLPVFTTITEPLLPRTSTYISMHFSNIRRLYLKVYICPKVLVNLLTAFTTEPDGTTAKHRLVSLDLHVSLIFGEQTDEQKDAILLSLWRIVDSMKTLRQLSMTGSYSTTIETSLPNVLLQLTEFGLMFYREDMFSLLSRLNGKILKKLSLDSTSFTRSVLLDLKFDFTGLTHLILGQDNANQPVNEPFLQVIVQFCPNLLHLDMKSVSELAIQTINLDDSLTFDFPILLGTNCEHFSSFVQT